MNVSRDVQLTSSNRRLVLRPYHPDDAPGVYQAVVRSKAELSRWFDWCTPEYSIQDAEGWLQSHPGAWEDGEIYGFAIVDPDSRQFLGGCALNRIQWDNKTANLGYWVRTDRNGQGIASDAALAVARFGIERLSLRRVEIITAVQNSGSRRVAEKTGAKFEGILRQRIKIGDRNVDAAMHSLIAADLRVYS